MNVGKGRILRVKEGYNPNSSSMGSIVFVLPVAAIVAPVLFSVIGGAALSHISRKNKEETSSSEENQDGDRP